MGCNASTAVQNQTGEDAPSDKKKLNGDSTPIKANGEKTLNQEGSPRRIDDLDLPYADGE